MEEDQVDVLLEFHDGDGPLTWRLSLTSKEYELLSKEVDYYNEWITNLFLGLAPLSCYEDKADADGYYLARRMIRSDNSYAGEFDRPGLRGYYEEEPYYFALWRSGEPEFEEREEEIAEKGDAPESFRTLTALITDPLGEEIGMGFRVLPMTARIIDCNVLRMGKVKQAL